MNLSYVKSYLEVVKRSSFSEAAKALGLSQPTVSFQVQRLERELDVKLLERQGGRVSMTEEGREFRTFAQRVVREEEALHERLTTLHDEVEGTLSLGASTNPGEQFLPIIVGEFRRRFPKARATISISDTAVIVDRVLERECDAGFVGASVRRRGLVVLKVAEDKLMLIVAPDHPLTQRNAVRLTDLEGESFVVREDGSGTQQTVEELMAASGLNPRRLSPVMVAGSNQAVVTAVEAGVGIAFASERAASRSLELGRIRAIPITDVNWVRGIYFIHPTSPVKTRLFQEFARFVEEWSARARD